MKRVLVPMMIFLIATACFAPQASQAAPFRESTVWEEAMVDRVAELVEDKAALQDWELTSLVPVRETVWRHGDLLEVTWMVNVHFRMAFSTVEDIPVIQGKNDFFKGAGRHLDDAHRAAAEENYEIWRNSMEDNLRAGSDATEFVTVRVTLDHDGSILPETLTMYLEDTAGEIQPADDILDRIPSRDEWRRQAALDMLQVFGPQVDEQTLAPAAFNGYNAAAYVNSWVKKTDKGLTCDGTWIYQDPNNYNKSYTAWWCSDCANFVSQALKYGGIPTDGTWKPYTNAWIRVSNLISWGTGTRKWGTVTSTTAVPGDVLKVGGMSHVMMVTVAQCPLLLAAHTNDRKDEPYTVRNGDIFYRPK